MVYCFPLIENLNKSLLTVNTVGFTAGLYNASIVANLMDTLYLLINEPSVANPERFHQLEALTDEKDAGKNKEKKVNPSDGWRWGGEKEKEGRRVPRYNFCEERSNTSSFPATQITFSKLVSSCQILLVIF